MGPAQSRDNPSRGSSSRESHSAPKKTLVHQCLIRHSRIVLISAPDLQERQILSLVQYLSEAQRLEQQGELVEAIWCYETILRDPLVGEDRPTLQAAGLGLGLLLITEARHCDEPGRVERLVNRAISALSTASRSDPAEPTLSLALAEAHILRFQLSGQTQDLLAANIQLDGLSETENPPLERITALRALLTAQR